MNNIELGRKIKFVESLNKTFQEFTDRFSVDKVEYKVFECTYNDNIFAKEYLVVTFEGGAISARNCTGNSLSAIFEELSHLIRGGYYDEVESYNYYLKNNKELDLNKEAN